MSNISAQISASKKRDYRLGKRAKKQEETRRRIVEAAVHLHSTVGPARTSVSQIADRAGVQRHTFYAHFPDERSLFLACSGLAIERDPLPDFNALAKMPSTPEKLKRGLDELYGWYMRNEELAACIFRDADYHALTSEMIELRMAPALRDAAEILGKTLSEQARALLGVALSFPCWRELAQTGAADGAAALMSKAVIALNDTEAPQVGGAAGSDG